MPSNLELVLDGITRAVHGGTSDVLADLLDQDVVWEGVDPAWQRCDGRAQAMSVVRGGRFAATPLALRALELVDAGERVLVGLSGPGMNGVPGDNETEGRLYQVFTFRAGKIVHWRAFLDRKQAFAAAGVADPSQG